MNQENNANLVRPVFYEAEDNKIVQTTLNTPESRLNDGYEETRNALAEYSKQFTSSHELNGKRLFYTRYKNADNKTLFDIFLGALPEDARDHYDCNTCRHFMNKYGTLVYIDQDGNLKSIIWNEEFAYGIFKIAIKSLRRAVECAAEVYLPFEFNPNSNDCKIRHSSLYLGVQQTGIWSHFYAAISNNINCRPYDSGHTKEWANHIYETSLNVIQKFSLDTINKGIAIASTDQLYKTKDIKSTLVAFKQIKQSVESSPKMNMFRMTNMVWDYAFRSNLLYHLSSSMEGSLLTDIQDGYSTDDVISRFNEKADPINYRRPKSAPTEGNIVEAEKIITELGLESALRRRYATLDEIPRFLWRPEVKTKPEPARSGIFKDVVAKDQNLEKDSLVNMTKYPESITFAKFMSKIAPDAKRIMFKVPHYSSPFSAYVTAADKDAKPILKYDEENNRNTFSSYMYYKGSSANVWNLSIGDYVEVLGILPYPEYMNKDTNDKAALFVLKGCEDTRSVNSSVLFPDILIPELYGVRKTIEAYSNQTPLEKAEGQLASGYMIADRDGFKITCVVETEVSKQIYIIYSWD